MVGPVAHDERPSKSVVVDAAVIERLAKSVGELSGEAGLEVREALWSLFFSHLAFFRCAAGKMVSPEHQP